MSTVRAHFLLRILVIQLATASSCVLATPQDEMRNVIKIARGISAVQPFLTHAKYLSYGIAIHKASRRFGIHPALLVSIAQQESGFRENLPEGQAGEIGICQILKSWLAHSELKREFGKLTVKDLKKPSVSFQIAAWILKDLQERSSSGPLPFWSFYNSPNFKHRLKYFQRVSQKIGLIRRHAPEIYTDALLQPTNTRALASFSATKRKSSSSTVAEITRVALNRSLKPMPTTPNATLLRAATID